ncbi:KTSC domain-containing protein [Leifsonia sp. TF02-11]|nr:KTSC domain-containing protein [Leifsonia sp. TF02-11]MBO1741866.1 KTSC domain-containing protein [Leifsonia sp. TF02-11]
MRYTTMRDSTGSFIVLRLSNTSDRGLLASTLPDNLAGLFGAVPVLRTGEALVIGEIVKLPTRVLIEVQGDSQPDSQDPEVLARDKSGGWDVDRVPQDYGDVASAWQRLTTRSRRAVPPISATTQAEELQMDRIPVNSSNLITVGYDAASQTLEVEFKDGTVYSTSTFRLSSTKR